GSFSQGGSTITQQVVKNALLNSEKKISRKLKEWILAVKLERVMSKADILTIYLNDAPYGGSIYGIEEASRTYFGKSATDLTLAEAAYLAALPNAPSYYSPYGNNKDRLEQREKLVLSKMLEKNFITEEEYATASAENITWRPQENTGIRAPHFVIYIKQYLEQTYGADTVAHGGLKVTTTLDYTLQEKAEELAKKYGANNEENFDAENLALMALDPKTGQILAMVGSRDYFDKTIDGNFNVTLAHRQPGSSFKPIVYAEALNKGFTPDTTVFDLPTEFDTHCNPDGTPIIQTDQDKCYMPENYDGTFIGPVSFRNALAQSRNIPAIKALYLAGLSDSLRLAKDMGVGSLSNAAQYGLTLVLGGGEVSLFDLSGAYGVFAAGGIRHPQTGILKVEDQNGTILESYTPHPIEVLSEQTALQISDILSDDKAREPEFGRHSTLYIPGRDVAAKTGTTNDYRDAWIIGYSPNIVVGAWAGNNDNSPMVKKIAGFIVAPFWNAVMTTALSEYPPEQFKKPAPINKDVLKPTIAGFWEGNQRYYVNKPTGELATELTPPNLKEARVVKQIHSILYWVNKSDPTGPAPTDPWLDPQFNLWEQPVRKWVTEQGIMEETPSIIPTTTDSMHSQALTPKIIISNPVAGLPYNKDSRMVVAVNITNVYPLSKVDYFINGELAGSSNSYPWNFSFLPSSIQNITDTNQLDVVVYDSAFNRGEAHTSFSILF
ncbi:MAG: transglycosylase domain-containing protein, partial [Candidatus Taylorbacteria bacterium]|nr:transglycosylase domain-containing protein [Candidatus Taylorbacteria bacterium]